MSLGLQCLMTLWISLSQVMPTQLHLLCLSPKLQLSSFLPLLSLMILPLLQRTLPCHRAILAIKCLLCLPVSIIPLSPSCLKYLVAGQLGLDQTGHGVKCIDQVQVKCAYHAYGYFATLNVHHATNHQSRCIDCNVCKQIYPPTESCKFEKTEMPCEITATSP